MPILATLILVGAAWLTLAWSARSPARAIEPAASPQEVATSDINITWGHVQPTNLSRSQEHGVSYGVRFPRIVANEDKAYVVWEAVYNGAVIPAHSETLLTQSEGLESWSAPQVVSDSLQTASEHTNFVQSTDGTLYLVWQEVLQGGHYKLMYQKRSPAGSGVSTEELDEFSELPVPVVASHGAQDVHLAWLGIDPGPDIDIFHMRSDDSGDSWYELAQAITLTSSSLDMALAIDSANNVHLAWNENLGSDIRGVILYRVGTPAPVGGGMSWGPVITPSATLTDCVKPSIVVSGTEAYIGWGKVLESQKLDIYFAHCSGESCTTPITLGHSVVVNTSDPSQSAPVLAMDEHGTLAAVWHGDQEHDEPGPATLEEILFTYSTDGGDTWASVQNVSQTPGQRSIDPHLALVDGVAHVVWKERYDGGPPQKYDVMYASSKNCVYLPLVARN
jgi:hypothetical protein